MGTLLMPVTMDDLSTPNATVTGETGRGKGMLCVARGSGLRHAVAPTRAAKTYSASYSIILVGLRPSCNPSEWTAMNLETRQACKYVSLRLPGLWPLMSPLTLLANGGLVFMTVDT